MTTLATVIARGILASRPAAASAGRLYFDTTNSIMYRDNGSSWDSVEGSGGMTNPMTTQGDIIYGGASGAPTRLAGGTNAYVLTSNGATSAPSWQAAAGGGSITTVDQDIGADLATNNSSTWTDITGLTGISLAAGTWMAFLDLELVASGSFGPVFRLSDGTTIFAQGGLLVSNPVAAVSSHYALHAKPFVLAGSATLKAQYFSDTAITIKRYPTRGGSSAVDTSHVTFLKLA